MNKYMILCAVGKDRSGIVDEVTSFLLKEHANIEDSRMAALGGRFSIMCLFSCSSERLRTIKEKMNRLNDLGLKTSLYDAENPGTVHAEDSIPLHVEAVSMDHPGIVQNIVHILKEHGVCIQTLETQLKPMPHTGTPLFNLKLKANVPVTQSIVQVKDELNNLASEMNLDLIFKG